MAWNVSKIIFLFSFLLFFSCTNDYKNLIIQPNIQPEVKIIPSIFENKKKATVFNASFAYKDYFASGLMVIKPIKKEHFRIVFTAKMGQTLLDTELTPTDFIIKKSIPQLDRKLLFNLLEKDLRLICDTHAGKAVALQAKNEQVDIFRIKTEKGFRYFYYNASDELINKIERGSKRKKKVVVDLENYKNDFPEKITIAHQGIQLMIEMKLIQG